MNAKPSLPQSSPLVTISIAALAAFVAVAIVSGIAFVFQRDGAPLQQLLAAERACVHHRFVSEREGCVRDGLATAHAARVASK